MLELRVRIVSALTFSLELQRPGLQLRTEVLVGGIGQDQQSLVAQARRLLQRLLRQQHEQDLGDLIEMSDSQARRGEPSYLDIALFVRYRANKVTDEQPSEP